MLVVALGASLAVAGESSAGHAQTGPLAYVVVEEGTSDTCTFGRLDLGSGALTTIGAVGGEPCLSSLSFAPDGTLYGIVGESMVESLVRVDPTTGDVTPVGSTGVSVLLAAGGLAFDRAGVLWLYIQSLDSDCAADFSCLYRIDPANAATTFVGGGGNETIVGGLAGQCDGRVLTARGVPPQQLASVDTTTGAPTDLGPLDPTLFTNELATEADGTLWGLANPNVGTGTRIERIDPAGPTVVNGPLLDDARSPLTFAIEPLTCPVPPPPAPARPLVLAPTFTG